MIPLVAVALLLRDAVRRRVLSAAYPRLMPPHPPPPTHHHPNRPLCIAAGCANGALAQMLHFASILLPSASKVRCYASSS